MNFITSIDNYLISLLDTPIKYIANIAKESGGAGKLLKERIKAALDYTAVWGEKRAASTDDIRLPLPWMASIVCLPIDMLYKTFVLTMRKAHIEILQKDQEEKIINELVAKVENASNQAFGKVKVRDKEACSKSLKHEVIKQIRLLIPGSSVPFNNGKMMEIRAEKIASYVLSHGSRLLLAGLAYYFIRPTSSSLIDGILTTSLVWYWSAALSDEAKNQLKQTESPLSIKVELPENIQEKLVQNAGSAFNLTDEAPELAAFQEALKTIELVTVLNTDFVKNPADNQKPSAVKKSKEETPTQSPITKTPIKKSPSKVLIEASSSESEEEEEVNPLEVKASNLQTARDALEKDSINWHEANVKFMEACIEYYADSTEKDDILLLKKSTCELYLSKAKVITHTETSAEAINYLMEVVANLTAAAKSETGALKEASELYLEKIKELTKEILEDKNVKKKVLPAKSPKKNFLGEEPPKIEREIPKMRKGPSKNPLPKVEETTQETSEDDPKEVPLVKKDKDKNPKDEKQILGGVKKSSSISLDSFKIDAKSDSEKEQTESDTEESQK